MQALQRDQQDASALSLYAANSVLNNDPNAPVVSCVAIGSNTNSVPLACDVAARRLKQNAAISFMNSPYRSYDYRLDFGVSLSFARVAVLRPLRESRDAAPPGLREMPGPRRSQASRPALFSAGTPAL